MKKYCFLFIILCLYKQSYCQPATKSGDELTRLLKKNSITIKSIDPLDVNYDDLAPIKQKIGNARLVVLGEDSHGDGETDKAKIRLVKFLHEKMGFDVIAWEFNYSLDDYMNQALRNDSLNTPANKYYGFGWDGNKPIGELISYARKTLNSSNPIMFAGFDLDRPPAGSYVKKFLYGLVSLNSLLNISESDKVVIDSLSGSIHGYWGNVYSKTFSKQGYTKSVNAIKALSQNLKNSKADILNKTDYKTYRDDSLMMESILLDIEIDSARAISNLAWNKKRDECMATRIAWLTDVKYPSKKIIIWAATAHLIRNSDTKKRLDLPPSEKVNVFKQAGDYVSAALGRQMYTIAFTSHHGVVGDIISPTEQYLDTLKSPMVNSYEDIAHKTGQRYLFTDLRNAPKQSWLSKDFIAWPLGYNEDEAQWNNIIDAFFFIDEMTPVEHKKVIK